MSIHYNKPGQYYCYKNIIIINIYFTINLLIDLVFIIHSIIYALIALISDQSNNVHILSLFIRQLYFVLFQDYQIDR